MMVEAHLTVPLLQSSAERRAAAAAALEMVVSVAAHTNFAVAAVAVNEIVFAAEEGVAAVAGTD